MTAAYTQTDRTKELKRSTRQASLGELVEACKYYTRYKSDLLQAGYDMGTNDTACVVCIRDAGIDIIRYASTAQRHASVFGDKTDESQWYIGEPGEEDPTKYDRMYNHRETPVYTFTFKRASAQECKDYLTKWFYDIE